jgi:hypothetical protein
MDEHSRVIAECPGHGGPCPVVAAPRVAQADDQKAARHPRSTSSVRKRVAEAKQAQPADVAAPRDARANHGSTRLVSVRRRRQFDRVAIAVQLDNARYVMEAASLPMLARSFDGPEDPAVEADEVTGRAKRNPMKIQGVCARWLHCCLEASQTERWSASGLARTAVRSVRSLREAVHRHRQPRQAAAPGEDSSARSRP